MKAVAHEKRSGSPKALVSVAGSQRGGVRIFDSADIQRRVRIAYHFANAKNRRVSGRCAAVESSVRVDCGRKVLPGLTDKTVSTLAQ
jgi:hypothetical protein